MATRKSARNVVLASKPSTPSPEEVILNDNITQGESSPASISSVDEAANDTVTADLPLLPHDAFLAPELGSLGVPADENEAEANRWRSFLSAAYHRGTNDHAIYKALMVGKKAESWKWLAKPDGARFATFKEFCEFEPPHGVGAPESEVIKFLHGVMAPRAAELIRTARARPGFRSDLAPPASSPESGGMSTRKAERNRAIGRAPEIVKDFYVNALLTGGLAEVCGPTKPSETERQKIAAVATELDHVVAEHGSMDALIAASRSNAAEVKSGIANRVRAALGVDKSTRKPDGTNGSKEPTIYAAINGDNADVLRAALKLYVEPGTKIADVTYNTGKMWRKTDDFAYDVVRFDLLRASIDGEGDNVSRADYRALPCEDASFGAIVMDPPYRPNPSRKPLDSDDDYGNNLTTILEGGTKFADIIANYEMAAREAFRVARPGGFYFVKCADVYEAGKLKLAVNEVTRVVTAAGFEVEDMFVLVRGSARPREETGAQKHARRNYSYLLVLKKPGAAKAEAILAEDDEDNKVA